MSGVEILSIIEEPIYQFSDSAFGITLFFTLVICFFIGSYISMSEGELFYLFLFSVLGVIVGVLFGIIIGSVACIETDEVETTYKVTISEEVSLNDFMEKYEIIDQEGKIYTVRERVD
jgi:hypothetical protein